MTLSFVFGKGIAKEVEIKVEQNKWTIVTQHLHDIQQLSDEEVTRMFDSPELNEANGKFEHLLGNSGTRCEAEKATDSWVVALEW